MNSPFEAALPPIALLRRRPFVKPAAKCTVRFLSLVALLGCTNVFLTAQEGSAYGRSISWQRVRSPYTPGAGAIVGGPGNDPNPGTPMYVCRAQFQGSLVPGKWVQGNCNIAFGNAEHIMNSYEIAYGDARWGAWRGNTYGLIQTGNEPDGSPLYSCRIHYFGGIMQTDYGYQPGKLVADGSCHIPMGGGEIAQNPPFEVLYSAGGGRPPYPYPYPYPPPPQPQPLPGCKLSDSGVTLDVQSGSWVGPNCSPSDGFGNIKGAPSYPSPYPPQPQYVPPPPPYHPGPSSVTWQPVQTPFQPGQGAIMGGPGNGPKPDAPLYVCRAMFNNGLYPGKWIEGVCSIADTAGKEQKLDSYEVANGTASWQNFDGNIGALVPGGYDIDGTHLYICRKQLNFFGNKGYQPGRLEGSQCHISYGGVDNSSGPPFEALYNVFPPSGPADQQQQTQPAQSGVPAQPAAQPHGVLVSFSEGTGATAGTITILNGSTGKTITQPIPANSTLQQCVQVLQQAAFEAGLQIQAAVAGWSPFGSEG